ncbi:MAG: hypothetical protein Q7U56_05965, partial [Humidesulfovibrio sp.]|nr:hypothetical protein [Humidesulfovibrio sp.]
PSTRVVLPWSTWAMMAMLRRASFLAVVFMRGNSFGRALRGVAGVNWKKGKKPRPAWAGRGDWGRIFLLPALRGD